MARGIDDVYTAFIGLCLARTDPVAGSCGRSNGYAALLLLHHPVHGSRTVVRFAYLMIDTGIIEYTLSSSRFTGVDVRHYADVAGMQ